MNLYDKISRAAGNNNIKLVMKLLGGVRKSSISSLETVFLATGRQFLWSDNIHTMGEVLEAILQNPYITKRNIWEWVLTEADMNFGKFALFLRDAGCILEDGDSLLMELNYVYTLTIPTISIRAKWLWDNGIDIGQFKFKHVTNYIMTNNREWVLQQPAHVQLLFL